MDIGDNPARKMEAKSIMISILLPVDLFVLLKCWKELACAKTNEKRGSFHFPRRATDSHL